MCASRAYLIANITGGNDHSKLLKVCIKFKVKNAKTASEARLHCGPLDRNASHVHYKVG